MLRKTFPRGSLKKPFRGSRRGRRRAKHGAGPAGRRAKNEMPERPRNGAVGSCFGKTARNNGGSFPGARGGSKRGRLKEALQQSGRAEKHRHSARKHGQGFPQGAQPHARWMVGLYRPPARRRKRAHGRQPGSIVLRQNARKAPTRGGVTAPLRAEAKRGCFSELVHAEAFRKGATKR